MTPFSSDLFFSVGTAPSLTMEQEEVNISLAVGKSIFGEVRTPLSLSFLALFIVLSLHKRAFQCPDVMEIEIQSEIRE